MKRAVIVGGFAEGPDLLDPIGRAVCAANLAEESVPFSFHDAVDYDQAFKKAADRQLVITHSAGIMAVSNYVRPELLVAYNGPEPKNIGRLVLAAFKKSNNHIKAAFVGPDRAAHLGTVGGNLTEFMLSPLWSLKQLKYISRFSTISQLSVMSHHGLAARGVADNNDEFGFVATRLGTNKRFGYQIIDGGGHDALLVNPSEIIAQTFPEND